MSYYEDAAREWVCGQCGSKGAGHETGGEMFEGLREVDCPQCEARLGLLEFPTVAEVRDAAARGVEEAKADLKLAEVRELRQQEFERTKLKGSDLPELPGGRLHFLWDEDGWKTLLRLGNRVLWEEPAFFEGARRFVEVREVLKEKYGDRFCALTPTPVSLLDLLGDRASSIHEVGLRELEESGLRVWPEGYDAARRFGEALAFAAERHAGQERKGTRIPYIYHPLAVASLVLEHGGDINEAIAALLHDVPEDCGGQEALDKIVERFGSVVADIVKGCTDTLEKPKPPWRPRKEAHIEKLGRASQSVRLVAAADKLHNARAILADFRSIGDGVWGRFTASKEGVLWYYGAVTAALKMQGTSSLVEELERTVAEMVREAAQGR